MTLEAVIARHRSYLFAVAYRMLGSAGDAEDIVQEAFVRWHEVTAAGTRIDRDRGWLTTVVTRLALDHLRSARVRREEYVGPWLPEPLVGVAGDVADDVIQAESISTAFLVLLERLSPRERAVFLLHDVFGYDFAAIGRIVGLEEANCRQIGRRARTHLEAGRPRFHPSRAEQQALVARFTAASQAGDLVSLSALLTAEVVLTSDGGATIQAARRPIAGRDKVLRFMFGVRDRLPPGARWEPRVVNGGAGVVGLVGEQVFLVTTFGYHGDQIDQLFILMNPDKLGAVPVSPAALKGNAALTGP